MRSVQKSARKGTAKALITTIALTSSVTAAWSDPLWSIPERPLVDDNLIVLLAEHTNRDQAKADFLRFANARTVDDIHFDHEDQSIFVLAPPPGQRELTLNKVARMAATHPEIIEVMRNYLLQHNGTEHKKKPERPDPGTGPNDTDFSDQWELGNMMWTQAFNKYASQMTNAATVVVLGNDCHPVGTELGPNITKYTISNKKVVGPVKIEPQHADGEGCADSSIPGAVTNNSQLIAGAACFQSSLPCNIILIKIADSTGSSTPAAARAIKWIIDNQSSINNGNAVPVDYSYSGWESKTFQALGKKLLNANDILVAAGGDPDMLKSKSTGTIAAIQATDYDNNLIDSRIQNDPMAAPGLNVPIINTKGEAGNFFSGTSAAAPLWGSCIALLIAFNQKLSGAQANQILVNTGTQMTAKSTKKVPITNPWTYVIPNVNAAINAALTETPPAGNMPPTAPTSSSK